MNQISLITSLVNRFPAVVPYLKGRARWIAFTNIDVLAGDWLVNSMPLDLLIEYDEKKTVEYFQNQIERMVTNVYNSQMQSEFIDIMANLIAGQLTQAINQARNDEDAQDPAILVELEALRQDLILGQYEHVDGYYRDIVNARELQMPIDPLLARASLWAQRWAEAYNSAVALIARLTGGNLVWQLGETEEHCETCAKLNGIVARATEWDELGIHPQGAPNDALECGGWRCDCSLTPTDKRRSPKAYDRIIDAVSK